MVFVYDETHESRIVDERIELLEGFNRDDAGAAVKTCALAKEGILVAFELYQDDPVDVEVAVGPPIAEGEAEKALWLEPQYARLSLPSGILRIHTFNTLPFADGEPDAEGARIELPPGDYRLTLQRLDYDGMEKKRASARGLPAHVITLLPSSEVEPVDPLPVLLCVQHEEALPTKQYRIEEGVFHGLIVFGDPDQQCFVNIDREAVAEFGITHGTLMRMVVDEPKFKIKLNVVYHDPKKFSLQPLSKKKLKQIETHTREFATSTWLPEVDGVWSDGKGPEQVFLWCYRQISKKSVPRRLHQEWIPVRVELPGDQPWLNIVEGE